MIDLSLWAGTALIAGTAAISLVVLIPIGAVARRQKSSVKAIAAPQAEATFLFREGSLCDSSLAETASFATNAAESTGWNGLREWLSPRFEGLPDHLSQINRRPATFPAAGPDDNATLTIQPQRHSTLVTLSDPVAPCAADRHELFRLRQTVSDMDATLSRAPSPIWKVDMEGNTIWQNNSCKTHFRDQPDILCHPDLTPDRPSDAEPVRIRIASQTLQDEDAWYAVKSIADDGQVTRYATNVTELVQAETAQREFVQTLTKTFATLTTGLVVFDKTRRLALFNPALIDHTGLSAEILSSRPSLMSFFDNLRDRRVMPEPKNYANWRSQINDVVETASGGLYQETWPKPDGTTIRVSGRPHPGGAVAFTFEDITAEVSLIRRFRSQLDIGQSVLDHTEEAIVVIGSRNIVLFCNKPCMALLDIDPDSAFAEMSAGDLITICQQRLPDTSFWDEVREALHFIPFREPLGKLITLSDGQQVECRFLPLSSQVTMFSASRLSAAKAINACAEETKATVA